MHLKTGSEERKKACMRGTRIPIEKDLVTVFLEHVRSTPHAVAIITSDTRWSYQELFQDVCVWKQHLHALRSGSPVMVCLHRTPRLVSLLLALQWLEIPYIPVEPKTPLDRIRIILDDSKAQAFLHDNHQYEMYMMLPCKIIAQSELNLFDDSMLYEIDFLKRKPDSKTIAYIIYTSGSTGTPKGVRVSRCALNNFLGSMSHYFLNEDGAVVLATTTFVFDIAALELYLPIWQQKTMFLAGQKEHKDALWIQKTLENYPIRLLQGTPSFWRMLHEINWDGDKDLVALCGGEPLTTQIVENLLPKVSSLWNMYGPTEATIWCSVKQIQPGTMLTVGRPIHNMEMYVLDASRQRLLPGKRGELYIGGLGLAEGYLNRTGLTSERFISYKHARGRRLYRTGDVAYMTHDGEFIILGRVDNQIKLHGYRMELEDIEAHIQGCSGVRSCAVQVYQEQLIAYVCCVDDTLYSETAVMTQLEHELPTFMVPKRFVYLESLPMNVSGKLNRSALPEPHHETHDDSGDVTPMQHVLLAIWREALGISSLGIHDNFFELGGHSLLAVRIITKIRQKLEREVTISDLYHAPSIAEFSVCVDVALDVSDVVLPTKSKRFFSWMPLTDFQFVLWVSHLFEPDVKQLNVVGRRRMSGLLNRKALDAALHTLIQKHDVLSYAIHRFLPMQIKKPYHTVQWLEEVFLDEDEHATEVYLEKSMNDLCSYQAWCKKKPLIIAKLFYLSDKRVEIQIAMPHMISDQQSLDILFRDLSSAYLFYARQATTEICLEAKPFESYIRHECHAIRTSLKTDHEFWETYLADAELYYFPKRYIVPNAKKENHSYSSYFPVPAEKLKQWRALCVKHAITLNDVVCAAIGLVLFKACNDENAPLKQLYINVVKSTREDPIYDDVIGCFLRAQAIKLNLTGEKNIVALAKQVQQSVLETGPRQHASSLIKLASIGNLPYAKKRIIPMMIGALAVLSSKIKRKQPYHLSVPILQACKRLAALDNTRGFVVNVNIWDSFFKAPNERPAQLFGEDCQLLPPDKKDIFSINDVLDVCLLKDRMENTAFLVLSANLKPEFREHLGNQFIEVLSCLSESKKAK
jgi:amino acid adenylation domain-containing protein